MVSRSHIKYNVRIKTRCSNYVPGFGGQTYCFEVWWERNLGSRMWSTSWTEFTLCSRCKEIYRGVRAKFTKLSCRHNAILYIDKIFAHLLRWTLQLPWCGLSGNIDNEEHTWSRIISFMSFNKSMLILPVIIWQYHFRRKRLASITKGWHRWKVSWRVSWGRTSRQTRTKVGVSAWSHCHVSRLLGTSIFINWSISESSKNRKLVLFQIMYLSCICLQFTSIHKNWMWQSTINALETCPSFASPLLLYLLWWTSHRIDESYKRHLEVKIARNRLCQ